MESHLRSRAQEKQQLRQFLLTLPGPSGIAYLGDKPDCILRHGSSSIGIEHTRLFHRSCSALGIVSPESESLEDQIAREAWKLHRSRGGSPRLVHIYFNKHRLRRPDVESLADQIQQFVAGLAIQPGESKEIQAWAVNRKRPGTLPLQIDRLWIDYVSSDDESLWGVSRGGAVPSLTRSHIESEIVRKEQKLPEYRKSCDAVWLLCVADGFSPATHFTFSDELQEEVFRTGFDRLFFLHSFSGRILEFQVVNP